MRSVLRLARATGCVLWLGIGSATIASPARAEEPHPRADAQLHWHLEPQGRTVLTLFCEKDSPNCSGKRVSNGRVIAAKTIAWRKARKAFEDFAKSKDARAPGPRAPRGSPTLSWKFVFEGRISTGAFGRDDDGMSDPVSNLEAKVSDLIDLD